MGTSSQPRGHFQQGHKPPHRVHKSGRHGHSGIHKSPRFGLGATSISSGQSSGYGSAGSTASACQTCGRVHQGPCYMPPEACFRCGKTGHYAR